LAYRFLDGGGIEPETLEDISMKTLIAVIMFTSSLALGCKGVSTPNLSDHTTPLWLQEQALADRRDRGEITKEQYKAGLKEMRETQP
jgi:hypothetical protein